MSHREHNIYATTRVQVIRTHRMTIMEISKITECQTCNRSRIRSAAKQPIKHALIRPNSRSAAERHPADDSAIDDDDGFEKCGERCATHGERVEAENSEPTPDFSAPDFSARLRPIETSRSPTSVAAVTVANAAATMCVRRCRCVPRRMCKRARRRDSSTGRADEGDDEDDREDDDDEDDEVVEAAVDEVSVC
jgi:hypothetical protein